MTVKGGREILFPLAGEFAAIVESCRGQHPERVFTYVVNKKRGKRVAGTRQGFTATGWRKFYYAAREAAGLPALRFHDLRHAFGNAMYAATGNIKTVQRAMCHSDVSSTLRYMHSDMGDVITGIEGMAASLPPAEPPAPPAPAAAEAEPVIYLKLRRA
jgi:integrase